jgi:hypothetical protein
MKWPWQRKKPGYSEGFRWAAGKLLAGATAQEIERYINAAYLTNSITTFDLGAKEALRTFQRIEKNVPPARMWKHLMTEEVPSESSRRVEHAWAVLVAWEYRLQEQVRIFDERSILGHRLRSRLDLIHLLAVQCGLPGAEAIANGREIVKWTKPTTIHYDRYADFRAKALQEGFEEDATYTVPGSARWTTPDGGVAVVYCTRAKGRNPLDGKPQAEDEVSVLHREGVW